jgi:hypothetical protein
MRGGPAEWIPAHGRRGKQLGAIPERPPICSTYQRGRRPRADGPVKKRGRRACQWFLRIRVSTIRNVRNFDLPWLIHSRKGTAPTYRAASARTNGLTGAMSGGEQYHGCREMSSNLLTTRSEARRAICRGRTTSVTRCVCRAQGHALTSSRRSLVPAAIHCSYAAWNVTCALSPT